MRAIGGAVVLAAMVATGAMGATVKDGVDAWQRADYATAVGIWRPMAEQGDADAAFNLAQAYKLGRGVPTDLAQAKSWYGKAAQGGHVQAAANYGLLLFQDGDRQAAMPYIRKAADAGDPRAQYVYGTALFNGDLAPKDWPKAYALMTRAGAAGLPQATTSLAQMDQFLSPADKQKGLAMATQLSSQPAPPISRTVVAAAPSPAPDRGSITPVDLPASTPYTPPPVTKPVKAPARQVAAKAPSAPVVKPSPAAIPAGGKWQVQLGAYGSEAGARTAWSGLTAKSPALRSLQPSYEKAGAIIRLRASGLADRGAAEKACAAAKTAGAACFPVAP